MDICFLLVFEVHMVSTVSVILLVHGVYMDVCHFISVWSIFGADCLYNYISTLSLFGAGCIRNYLDCYK